MHCDDNMADRGRTQNIEIQWIHRRRFVGREDTAAERPLRSTKLNVVAARPDSASPPPVHVPANPKEPASFALAAAALQAPNDAAAGAATVATATRKNSRFVMISRQRLFSLELLVGIPSLHAVGSSFLHLMKWRPLTAINEAVGWAPNLRALPMTLGEVGCGVLIELPPQLLRSCWLRDAMRSHRSNGPL